MTRTDSSPVPSYPDLLRLDGRGTIVVGAGQGIGRQAAHALASVGARVFCIDKVPELAHDIAAEVGGVAGVGDVIERGTTERLFASAVAEFGRVQHIVDIVGMAQYADLLEMSDENWDWHHDVCVRQAMHVVRAGGRALRDGGGGSMALVASVSGISSAPRHAAYGVAKAGLMSLVRSAAVELGPLGIRVNAVAPGVVWTPRVSAALGDEGRAEQSANAPLGTVARPADIAAALLFLISDLAGYISGQTLTVDGGVGVKFPYPMRL
ncbi:MAG TPA: SDR family oxidoreductase [Acidimicrobiales bacterium]|nr:SDR family oxidoreductase [Acidimicrobiales bacterium]